MTTIATVNVATVQAALGEVLKGWPDLMDMTALTIEHGEAFASSELQCPWPVSYTHLTLPTNREV